MAVAASIVAAGSDRVLADGLGPRVNLLLARGDTEVDPVVRNGRSASCITRCPASTDITEAIVHD